MAKKFNISPMLARILVNRNLKTDEEFDKYLNGDFSCLYDAFLFKGMHAAVNIILESAATKDKVRIVGDYDVDGVCSAYILKSFFETIFEYIDVRLPDRLIDGYGLNVNMIDEAHAAGINLIITCDNGISAHEAVKRAGELGIKVIITDHHEIPDILPDADVIINAKQADCPYPNKDICGAGVAYKLVCAVYKVLSDDCATSEKQKKLIDSLIQFAGMATITDIVSLKGENRIIAKEGIERLHNTDNIGLKALLTVKNIIPESIKSFHIGFIIGPCINSAGRLKNADIAFKLLCSNDEKESEKLAVILSDLNEERKALTLDQTSIAEKIIDQLNEDGRLDRVIVINLPDAHESVAGIIAGKLKDEYNRPAMVITSSNEGLKGSARSTDEFNIAKVFSRHKELFKKYGGHAKAAGFTLNCSVETLSSELNNDPETEKIDFNKKIWIDMQLPFKYASEAFCNELKTLEPYGLDNPKPVFAEKNIKISKIQMVGQKQNVLKLTLEDLEGFVMEGVMFGNKPSLDKLFDELSADLSVMHSILYFPEVNEYRNIKTVNAVLYEIR